MSTSPGRARWFAALLGTAAAVAAVLSPVSASAAPSPRYNDCGVGLFCVWSGSDASGQKCEWRVDDLNWQAGSRVCKWAKGTRVRSVYNHGESGAPVSAYTAVDYGGTKAFCLRSGARGNLKSPGT
ncbi:peptidase inhibitor family I36 protein [Streptomyces sp. NPDC090108]